jgi:hypothetical protein
MGWNHWIGRCGNVAAGLKWLHEVVPSAGFMYINLLQVEPFLVQCEMNAW